MTDRPNSSEATTIATEIAEGLPDRMAVVLEDLAATYEAATVLYRARVHKDPTRTERFTNNELGAPPANLATAGRANQEGQPLLYLATNKSTALAEVRPWKHAAVAVADVHLKRQLSLVDLSRTKPLKSPFFVDLLRWKVELAGLLHRLGRDMSRPVMPHEEKTLYKPTQLLALLIKSNGYDGCVYPSAMGSGKNVVLFNPDDAQVTSVGYAKVSRIAYFPQQLAAGEPLYDEGPYDYARGLT